MLDDKMRGVLDHLIDRTTISFHTLMSSIRIDKADFHIQNESDYAMGLAHGMILTGFISDFKTHYNREPNQEEMIEVSKVLLNRTRELREAISKSE
ncbi:MAG TPA: hypothetical protein VE378_05395 [Nitrososphaeraceae archaeon]|jgi:hypothetical protein|nr:hypothetical protein [Nitrososphaeraceae archaeon]